MVWAKGQYDIQSYDLHLVHKLYIWGVTRIGVMADLESASPPADSGHWLLLQTLR